MAYKFLKKTSSALDAHTATTIVGSLARDPRDINRIVPMVSLQTYAQSVRNVHAENSGLYNSTSVVGLDTIFRPYTMDQNQGNIYPYTYISGEVVFLGSGLPYLPVYQAPSSIVVFSGSTSITSASLNPFINISGISLHDAEWISSGPEYSGLHIRKKYDDLQTNARSIALKGPIISSWGYNIAGNPVPHQSGDVNYDVQSGHLYNYSSGTYPSGKVSGYNIIDPNNVFADYAMSDSTQWKTGPLACLWNDVKGTWGFNAMIKGKFDETVPASTGIGVMNIYIRGQNSGKRIRVGNCFSSAIPPNVLCMANWDIMEDYFYVSAMDCQ